jgi:hypothetical protein
MRLANRIAKLAVARSRMQHAFNTARAVGDSQYIWDRREAFDTIDRCLEAIVKCAPQATLDEVRDITNAPI